MTAVRRHLPALAGAAVFLLLLGGAAVRYDGFLSLATLVNLLGDNSFLGIAAVGLTLVILSGGIDLSVGAVMGLATVLIGALMMDHDWPAPLAMLAAVGAGAGIGAGSGCLIHFGGLKPFIATLAAMFVARGLAFLITLESMTIDDELHTRWATFALPAGGGAYLPLTAIAFLCVAAAGTFVLVLRPLGRYCYALGGNEEAARLMGVPVGRTKVCVYGLSGGCAALAGCVLTLYAPSGDPTAGIGMELDAIASVVIGGTLLTGGVGSVPGTVIGVLTIGLIVTIVKNNESLSSGMTKVAIGGLLLGFVGLQRGLARWGGQGK